MKYNASNFFDENENFYGKTELRNYDYYISNFIKKTAGKNRFLNLLDIGGGSGRFANLVVIECPNIKVTLLDPSKKLLNKIKNDNIIKIVGILPNIICFNSSFYYIHIKEVFHHITGSSIEESKKLLKKSLQNMKVLLDNDGFLFVHELFYESPVIPTLSSTMIFYLLKIQNKCGIKFPTTEFRKGLEVYFYTRKEFRSILHDCGYEIVDYYEEKMNTTINFKKKLLFIKDWGRMVFICKKVE